MLEAAEREERRERASDLENGDTEGVAGISAAPASTPTITITGLPVTASNTVVPIREEFRCRRFWLFYHDLRAFTTSVSNISYAGLGHWHLVASRLSALCIRNSATFHLLIKNSYHAYPCICMLLCCVFSFFFFSFFLEPELDLVQIHFNSYNSPNYS